MRALEYIFVVFIISNVYGETCDVPNPTYTTQRTACINVTSDIIDSSVIISFTNSSISTGCAVINISRYSAFIFEESEDSKLGIGQFMSVGTPPFFSVIYRGIAVGTLIGHGVQISSDIALSEPIEICLIRSPLEGGSNDDEREASFDIYDFATSATSTLDTLTPMNLVLQQNTTGTNRTVCSLLDISSLSGYTIFPIKRLENWKTAKRTSDSRTDISLTYCLAGLFGLLALIAGGQTVLVIFRLVVFRSSPVLTDFVIFFVFLFLIMRAIHLFLVAAEVSMKSAEFTLAVLPTFFYFTAFSLIAAFWAAANKKHMQMEPKQLIYIVKLTVIGLNVFLFSIFLVLALCYHFLVVKSDCNSRTPTRAKTGVSIAYSVTVASLSLVIGVAFNHFGKKLHKKLGMSSQSRKLQKQVSTTSSVLASCFLVHCIFIVLQSLMSTPIVIFGFIGLIITELLPAASFLAANNSLHALRRNVSESSTHNTPHLAKSKSSTNVESQISVKSNQ